MRTILQVPVNKDIRILAEKSALNMGFSSLQESLRMIMYQMAQNKLSVQINAQTPDEMLTLQQEKRLMKKVLASKEEIEKGKYFQSNNPINILDNLNSYNE